MNIPRTDPLLPDILSCETRVWEALVAGDAQADAALLDPGFLGVYPDGFAGKSDHVAQLEQGPSMAAFDLSEPRLLRVGPDHVLLSYRAQFRRAAAQAAEVAYVSSLWRRQGTGWINLFSQDTPG